VALRDEGSEEDAVEADDRTGLTAVTEAIQPDEHGDVGESAEAEAEAGGAVDAAGPEDQARPADEALVDGSGSRQEAGAGGADEIAAVTEAPPAAEPAAAAEDPAATLVDLSPGELIGAGDAGGGTASAGGGAGSGDWIRNVVGGARRPSWKIATAAGVAAAIAIAVVVVAANSSTAASHKTVHKKKAIPITVVSVSPGNGSTDVNGASPITITYSGRVTERTPLPTLSPSIAGSWQVSADKATFTPQVGYTENTRVTVNVPAPAGTTTTAAMTVSFTTGQYSVLRLEQLLAQLGYLPVTWTPADPAGYIPSTDASAQLAAAYNPPPGTFSFDSGYPAALTSLWSVGTDNEVVNGAVRTFQFDHNLPMSGDAGPRVWSHLFTAIANGQQNQHGYTYVWVTQAGAEHLILYHNGHVAITSPVNTGIAASPTADGTFPVYLRYTVTQMIGTNPDGTPYDDTVYWVSYFNGGDAVHAFPRGSYGWYQSLGCVELPTYGSTAEDVWNLITYGTLVTVTGPVA
jgi:L,D-transpeptidase catalytic domain